MLHKDLQHSITCTQPCGASVCKVVLEGVDRSEFFEEEAKAIRPDFVVVWISEVSTAKVPPLLSWVAFEALQWQQDPHNVMW